MSPRHSHTYSSVRPRTRVMMDDDLMREILADVGQMRTPMELELWASWLLGQTWKQRVSVPLYEAVDWNLTLGSVGVSMIARIGGARARKALTALSLLDRGAFGAYAGAVALTLPGARMPAWIEQIASARFVAARRCGAGLFLDLERAGQVDLTVAVMADESGAATRLHLAPPLPPESEEDGPVFDAIELRDAAEEIRHAIAVTDANPQTVVAPDFADLRAFVLARALDAAEPA